MCLKEVIPIGCMMMLLLFVVREQCLKSKGLLGDFRRDSFSHVQACCPVVEGVSSEDFLLMTEGTNDVFYSSMFVVRESPNWVNLNNCM